MKTICIIPARGGSKGIPKKNIIDFNGQPLISYSINQALACDSISSVYVTSDCENILEVSQNYGAKTILRPPEISKTENCFIWQEKPEGIKSINYDYKHRKMRQELTSQYTENGSIYIFEKSGFLKKQNRIFGKKIKKDEELEGYYITDKGIEVLTKKKS